MLALLALATVSFQDYSLATLKVREATMQLEELSAEHESLIGRMADSL